jgi:hypothetical protein
MGLAGESSFHALAILHLERVEDWVLSPATKEQWRRGRILEISGRSTLAQRTGSR